MIITHREWNQYSTFGMVWSIFPEGWDAYAETDVDDWPCDITAPKDVPDGIYMVKVSVEGWGPMKAEMMQHVKTVIGIQIKNGAFVPEPTAKACYSAELLFRRNAFPESYASHNFGDPIDHRFIEELRYDGDCFILRTGS